MVEKMGAAMGLDLHSNDISSMNPSIKKLLVIFMMGILCFSTGYVTAYIGRMSHHEMVKEGGQWHNIVIIEVKRAHSLEEYRRVFGEDFTFENDYQIVHNVLTNEGKDFLKRMISDSSAINASQAVKWIGLSCNSSTPTASWNATQWHNSPELTAYGLGRAAGTYSSTGVGQWQVQKQFTATGTVSNVRLAGLLNTPDGDPNEKLIFVAALSSSVNLEANDQITITWQISISES